MNRLPRRLFVALFLLSMIFQPSLRGAVTPRDEDPDSPAAAVAGRTVACFEGPLARFRESIERIRERRASTVGILSRYLESALPGYARPSSFPALETLRSLASLPDRRLAGEKVGRFSVPVTRRDTANLFKAILMDLKKDVAQGQVAYSSCMLQGMTPLQWYLLSSAIPSRNTFTFHRTLLFLEQMFEQKELAMVIGPLDQGFRHLACVSMLRGYGRFRLNRSVRGWDRAAVEAARRYSLDLARRYYRYHGASMTKMAEFFALLCDTLSVAGASGSSMAANQLWAVYADLRLLSLRLGGLLRGPSREPPPGRPADYIRLAVRETLIYGPRMFDRGLRRPSRREWPGLGPRRPGWKTMVDRAEVLQKRLLQLRSVQRRALRALSEWKRLAGKVPGLDGAPAWEYGDTRARLGELENEVRECVYGRERKCASCDSVEGLLYEPTLSGEMAAFISALPAAAAAGAGTISAAKEVLRLIERISADHENMVLPFLHSIDLASEPSPGEDFRLPRYPSSSEAASRLVAVERMLKDGRDGEGTLLTPEQKIALELERRHLKTIAGAASEAARRAGAPK